MSDAIPLRSPESRAFAVTSKLIDIVAGSGDVLTDDEVRAIYEASGRIGVLSAGMVIKGLCGAFLNRSAQLQAKPVEDPYQQTIPFCGGGSHVFAIVDKTTGETRWAKEEEKEGMLGDYATRNLAYAKDQRTRTGVRTNEETYPYPWCRDKQGCADKGSCPKDPNCGE